MKKIKNIGKWALLLVCLVLFVYALILTLDYIIHLPTDWRGYAGIIVFLLLFGGEIYVIASLGVWLFDSKEAEPEELPKPNRKFSIYRHNYKS